MDRLKKISLILFTLTVMSNATMTTKDVRTAGLPEKIIGGVIEIVHSHKNKPPAQQSFQPTYPNQNYQPQYPQYQQWNGQSQGQSQSQSQGQYQGQQGQGFNYHGQYQNQGQYGNYQNQNGYNQGTTYPQNAGNYNNGQGYPPAPVGSFNNGQSQSQGQYQIVYQNQSNQPPYGTTGQYQNNQHMNQQFPQSQSTGNFQGQNQNSGIYQGQQRPGNNSQGSNGSFHGQGNESGGQNQGFQVSGGHQTSGNGSGPTCVCQAWTKPSETLNDPTAEKTEKMSDESAV